jgi:hypothetical protein
MVAGQGAAPVVKESADSEDSSSEEEYFAAVSEVKDTFADVVASEDLPKELFIMVEGRQEQLSNEFMLILPGTSGTILTKSAQEKIPGYKLTADKASELIFNGGIRQWLKSNLVHYWRLGGRFPFSHFVDSGAYELFGHWLKLGAEEIFPPDQELVRRLVELSEVDRVPEKLWTEGF